jgi:GT2 family glycosyltransferase
MVDLAQDVPFVRLVVLNWNAGGLLERCLDSLHELEWPPDRFEIVVIDNASTDGSVDGLATSHPGVRLVRNSSNIGFGANNLALADLEGVDQVGLVNPDVVTEPTWLSELSRALVADPGLGAACPKILLGDGSGPLVVQNTGSVVDRSGNSRDRGFGEPDGPAFDQSDEVFAWCGASVLLRADCLADIGLFEERFFLYYEDTDLSWRGQSRGWRYRYVPTAVAYHVHGAATGLIGHHAEGHQLRNRLLLMTRNAPGRLVAFAWTRATVGLLRRGGPGFRTRAWALGRAIRALPWALTSRKAIRRQRIVADRVVVRWLRPTM